VRPHAHKGAVRSNEGYVTLAGGPPTGSDRQTFEEESMKRIFAIGLLVIGASYLLAADPPASSSSNAANPAAVEETAGGPPPPHAPPPEGWLANSLGADKLTKKTGVKIWDYAQGGFSTNNVIQKGDSTNGAATSGDGTGPFAGPADADTFNFDQVELFIEKDIKGTTVMGPGGMPGPFYKHFDWGFMSETAYGRQANGCRMAGFDRDWSINPSPKNDATQRYLWLCEPNANIDLYFPVLRGIGVRIGRQPDQLIELESPPMFRMSPDMFYTHPYGFFRNSMNLGVRIAPMIFNNPKQGVLMAEFFMSNGGMWGTSTNSLSGSHPGGYGYALHYKSPDMSLWMDYTGRIGPGNIKANADCGGGAGSPGYSFYDGGYWDGVCTTPIKPLWVSDVLGTLHVFSPRNQTMFENALAVQKELRPQHMKLTGQIQWGKQYGDGKVDTIATYSPPAFGGPAAAPNGLSPIICSISLPVLVGTGTTPLCRAGFTGASYLSYMGQITYNLSKTMVNFPPTSKWNVSMRAEQFRNPNGYFNEPPMAQVTNAWGPLKGAPPDWGGVHGAFNDISWGVNYNAATHVRIRPEIRYDWQTGNYQYKAYGQGNPNGQTSSSQVTASMDTVFYF
jgi:hypothetical protein